MSPGALRVGADARPITPDLSKDTVFLAGFDFDRPATEIHDPLMVRSIAFDLDGGDPVVISVCDLVGLTRTHEPKGRRVVACTHTHHGPDGLGFWGRPLEGVTGLDHQYIERVRREISRSQDAAIAALEPATISTATVAIPDLVANYRDAGIVDDELAAFRAYRADGSVIATFVDYPCHPEVVAADNTEVTADYPGYLCRRIEATSGGTAVFAVGAIGGMMAPSTEVRTHDEAARYGQVLADAVEHALAGGERHGLVELAFARADVQLVLQNPIYELGMELGLVMQAELRGDLAVTEVSVVRIGPAMIACVPGELLPKLGFRLKDAMRAAGALVPIIVGLADDELGYLIAEDDFTFPEDYLDPGKQYEESFSAGPTAGPRVVDAVESLVAAF